MKSDKPPPHLSQAPDWYRQLILGLRQKRVDLGLSQFDIEMNMGCAQGLVSKWECYDRRPTGYMLALWVHELGLTLHIAEDNS